MVHATTRPPPTRPRSLKADRDLARALYAVVQGSRHAVQDPVDRVTVTVLADVGRLGPIRPSDLAEELRLDLSTVSRHASALVDRGLLTRASDPADARAQRLQLTAEGHAVLTEVLDSRAASLGRALQAWSRTDRKKLTELLERLAADLQGAAR